MHRGFRISMVLAGSSLSLAALALSQPDATVIPVGPSLQALFDSRGEAISALADAAVTPETFTPGCALTFEVLQRNAGYMNSFGWYNVTGSKPLDSELHEFLACTDGVGTVKVLDIKNDAAYLGGDIGFYEGVANCAAPGNYLYVFYSEKAFNPDSSQQNPFIHLLIYNSTAVPKAFYFGWEDLLSGGDNDFDDLTTFVTGITCSGGGGSCDTGIPGVCADGTLQCQGGALGCVQLSQPSAEKCDGLDNDCNSDTDEGADLCPSDEVCDRGSCVPTCNSELFQCPPGKVCSPGGVCVDPNCVDTVCPSGEKCVDGNCVAPCDGVLCPYGQICLVGKCVAPCGLVTCDSAQLCVAGVCQDPCQCAGCSASDSCEPDGRCTPTACVGNACPPGSHCVDDGSCVDDCQGAVCPTGEVCEAGACIEGSAGGAGGGAGEGGGFHFGGSGGAGANTGASSSDGDTEVASSCGCRLAPRRATAWGWLAALAALGAFSRRKRADRR